MLNRSRCLLLFMAIPALAAEQPAPAHDRGLPQANLNNVSGVNRSNVRWEWHERGFLGDDFVLGSPGERWVVEAIRTWTVPGQRFTEPLYLADYFQDLRLYVGGPEGDLTPVVAARLTPGSDETGTRKVRITEITRTGHPFYDEFGDYLRIWQIDFTDLNWVVEGGVKNRFGVWGNGRPVPGTQGKTYKWFNHASNASLGGVRQDGADGVMLLFEAAGRSEGTFTGEGNGWDKNCDINVQIFARRISQ